MFTYVPKLENIEEAVVQAETALALLKKARTALRDKRQAQKLAKDGLKRLQTACLAMFGGETKVPLMSHDEVRKLADEKSGRIELIVGIPFNELACVSSDETLDGLNDWVDDAAIFGGYFNDLNYRAIAVDYENDLVYFEVDADCTDFLDDAPEEDDDGEDDEDE